MLLKECGRVQQLTIHKQINSSDWWKGKFALFQMPANERRVVDVCPKANSPSPPYTGNQWGQSFYTQKERLCAEPAQSALRVIFKLISIILIVLGTVNLQFQWLFVPIPLRPVLGIVRAHVLVTVWSSCSNVSTWCFNIYKAAQ